MNMNKEMQNTTYTVRDIEHKPLKQNAGPVVNFRSNASDGRPTFSGDFCGVLLYTKGTRHKALFYIRNMTHIRRCHNIYPGISRIVLR